MTISQPSRGLRRSLANRFNRHSHSLSGPYLLNGVTYPTTNVENFSLHIDVEAGDRAAFAFETISTASIEGSALLEIQALTSNGTRIAIPQWGYRSNRIQEYQYLTPAEPGKLSITAFSVPIPPNASTLKLIGHRWKNNVETSVVGQPIINRESLNNWQFETETGARLEFPAYRCHEFFELDPQAELVQLTIDHVARDFRSSGPVAIKFFDEQNTELMPVGQLAQHSKFGPIILLNGAPDAYETTLVELLVPFGARYISVQGLDWSAKTAKIVGRIRLEVLRNKELTIDEFIAAIPVDEQLFVVDTTAPPIGHETLGLRPNNLSLAAIKKSHWVVFLPFSSLQEFPAHPEERLYQVPRSDMDKLWTALRTYRRGTNDNYICSSFPSFEAITAAYDLRRLGWQVIYEVRDDMEEFNRVGYSKWYRPVLEQKMLTLADKVVSVSRALDEKMVVMQPNLGSHVVIPNGVRQSVIESSEHLRTIQAARKRDSSRVAGYVGHLTDSWFDWPLLMSVAKALPDVTFEIVGHGMPDRLTLPSNIIFLGPKSHEELLELVESWKVGLIPFKDIPLTHSVDPNKIYEYFAWGLRCVTVQMGSVDTYPWTKVYNDFDSMVKAIQSSIETPTTEEDLNQLSQFTQNMSWDDRVEDMLSFIGTKE